MAEKIIIKKANKKPFQGEDGEFIDYFWYKGFRIKDGVTIDIGSIKDHALDSEVSMDLEKIETAKGGFRYKEIVPKETTE